MRLSLSPPPFLLLISVLFGLLASTAGPAPAQDAAPSAMLLIDGSGSMWGRLEPDKRAKIDIVREHVSGWLTQAPQSRIGLASFGHRRRGDCSDVEVLVKPDAPRDALAAPLAKLSPIGKGPLVAGLREAAAAIGSARPARILVINDNADNCQQDACAAADDLARTQPGLAVDVVGIAVPPDQQQRLVCIARATGGSYYDAQDSTSLQSALTAALRSAGAGAVPAAGAPAEVATAAAKGAPALLTATAVLTEGGAALGRPVRWRVFKSGDTAVIAETEAETFSAKMDAGRYDLEAGFGTLTAKRTIALDAGGMVSTSLPLKAGRLRIKAAPAAQGAGHSSAVTTITQAGADAQHQNAMTLGGRESADIIMPPGQYLVATVDGVVRLAKTVTVAEGSDSEVDLMAGTGSLELTAADETAALDDVVFTVSEDDPESANGRRDVARSRAPLARFLLPAGTYYITARSGAAEVREQIALNAGDTVKKTLSVARVPLTVSVQLTAKTAAAGDAIVYRVIARDGDGGEVAHAVAPQLSVLLPPGRYRATALLTAQHLSQSADITLAPGKPVNAVLKLDVAEVALRAPGPALGPSDLHWAIVDEKGATVWRGTGNAVTAIVPPGRYTARLDSRDKRTEAAFDVRSGEQKNLEIGGH